MKTNQILAIVAGGFFLLSVFSYWQSTTRAERFERGQKFLSQLNADNIHTIEVTKDGEQVVLKRADEQFLVTTLHDYPAKNETVNRFINDTLNISLEKEVGTSPSLAKELEVDPEGEAGTEVVFKNEAGKTMVHFLVGKASDDGQGNYVRRLDGDDQNIYLSSRGIYLSTSDDSFLQKEILDVSSSEIAQITGGDYAVVEDEGNLKLQNVPDGKEENTSNLSQVKNMLSALRYDKVFLADDEAVASLSFDSQVEVRLKDDSGYRLALAKKDDQHYLQIEAFYDVEQIRISQEESEEELEEKSKILSRAEELKEFNQFHGSWVYQLSEITAKKFLHTQGDLVKDKEKEPEKS